MRKKNSILVLILCIVMVFTSCGTGGLSDTTQLPADTGNVKAQEITVDDSEVKLETNIVSGDPAKIATLGENADKSSKATAEPASVKTVGNSKTATSEKEKDTEAVLDAIFGNKDQDTQRADETNVSDSSSQENFDQNGNPDKPYDEINPDVFEDEDVKYADNAILIKFKKTFQGKLTKELKKAGIGKLEFLFDGTDYAWYTGYILKSANLAETMENVRGMESVITAEYNFVSEATADTDDAAQVVLNNNPKSGEQWVLNSCGIREAWKTLEENGISAGGDTGVVVAVIDTGVDYTHKDLKANMWVNSKETSNNSKDDDGNGYVDDYYGVDITAGKGSAMDDEGHGTHVAGIIAAANNKEGVVGIAYNTKIMAIKAGDASGFFLQNNVAKAIIYAYENGADVINMSFGGSESSIAVKDALETAYGRCVLVASAGNSGYPNEGTDYYFPSPNYPAAFSFVLGVMSAGQDKTESAFSNWDATLFNTVEYEVYAPGEQILSTLPGDRYAKLSGTSMAAPVVAAEAALLRSYYSDTSRYPTKYIYGQIVGGTDESVKCADPKKHTINKKPHKLPGMINFEKAFTYVPKPDIGISDYTLFDTQGFTADTEGLTAGCESVNNGDGILDAGETIALGFTLRNRWGMSKNTKVHIDADSSTAGIEHPYVEFLNNDLDYGSIGTYSESDSGKLYTDDVWTGWQNPFYVRVSKDCPNEYTIRLNITVTYENGLDDTDTTVYKSSGTALFTVRRGIELPSRIESDMTLTKDNYYIIPNATAIAEGATVTVEPGTKIQFWCSDPKDAYADTAITYLKVEGKFICNGTETEPIELFPSEWMGKHRVQIYDNGNGYTELNYTNVTNAYLWGGKYDSKGIDIANNCEFKQNYKKGIYYRSISEAKIASYESSGDILIEEAKECSFYKLGADGISSNYPYKIDGGNYERCIFTDSYINYGDNWANFKNCVFYGNNNYNGEKNGGVSRRTAVTSNDSFLITDTLYDYENGILYLTGKDTRTTNIRQYLAGINLSYATISSQEELDKVTPILDTAKEYHIANITLDENLSGSYSNGEKIPEEILLKYANAKAEECTNSHIGYKNIMGKYAFKVCAMSSNTNLALYQVDIPIYMENIKLDRYLIDLDMESTYQISPQITPINANPGKLLYECDDESVATVDENGLVTPIKPGTVKIEICSADKAIKTYITINVRGSIVAPERIMLSPEEVTLIVGENISAETKIIPRHATKYDLSYESTVPEVASVDELGTVTAHAPGDAQITVTGYGGAVGTINVHCVLHATGMKFRESMYVTNLEKEDEHNFYPELSPTGTTDTELVWESANPDICYVDETGKLVKLKEGMATLRATIKNTVISASIQVVISNQLCEVPIKKMGWNRFYSNNDYFYVLLENGTLWRWKTDNSRLPEEISIENTAGKIIDYVVTPYNRSYLYVLDESGQVLKCRESGGKGTQFIAEGIKSLSYVDGDSAAPSYYAITTDGGVWGWGENGHGQLGDGTTFNSNEPIQVSIDENIKQAVNLNGNSYFLSDGGDVYILGYSSPKTPLKIESNVINMYRSDDNYVLLEKEMEIVKIDYYYSRSSSIQKTHEGQKESSYYSYYVEDGSLCIKGTNSSEYVLVEGIEDVANVYIWYTKIFVSDTRGNTYHMTFGETPEIKQVYFGVKDFNTPLTLEGWNHAETVETGNTEPDSKIVLDFDGMLNPSSAYGSISLKDSAGTNCMLIKKIDLDKLYITPRSTLKKGEHYTLTIPEDSFTNDYFANKNAEITLSFIYDGQPILSDWNHTEETLESSEGEKEEKINVVTDELLTLDYDVKIFEKSGFNQIVMKDSSGKGVAIEATIAGDRKQLQICPTLPFTIGETYTLTVPAGALVSRFDVPNEETVLTFTYKGDLEKKKWNISEDLGREAMLYDDYLQMTYNGVLEKGSAYDNISVSTVKKVMEAGEDGIESEVEKTVSCAMNIELDGKNLTLTPAEGEAFEEGRTYTLSVPENALKDVYSRGNAKEIQQTFVFYRKPALEGWNKNDAQEGQEKNILSEGKLILKFAQQLTAAAEEKKALLVENDDAAISTEMTIAGDTITIIPKEALYIGREYTLTVPAGICQNEFGAPNEEIRFSFLYNGALECTGGNYTVNEENQKIVSDNNVTLQFNDAITLSESEERKITLQITELTDEGLSSFDCEIQANADGSSLTVTPTEDFEENIDYVLTIPAGILTGASGKTNEEIKLKFDYQKKDESVPTEEPEMPTEPDPNEPAIPDDSAYDVVNSIVTDAEKMAERTYLTKEDIEADWAQYVKDGLNTTFKGNAILNRLIDDDVSKWLRITAPSSSTYQKIGLGGNYWGTTSQFLINKQILDYDDYQDLADINEGKYLTEAPKDTWPFVVNAYVMIDGETVDTVGNQEVTFAVDFNRDMDTSIPLKVAFGSSYPYNDYEVVGEYKTPTHWEGTVTLKTLIENGYQRWSISNGKAAGTSMKLYKDWGRFQFKIDTTAAQALIMQAEATKTGIKLTWSQDEFDTLAGYNVYRATKEDGLYTKLNKTIIAADTKEWFDDTVTPGEKYYYNFTVVESDMTESEPSGKIVVRAFDTMAPDIYHSPVYHAFTGSKLMISAIVTDNVAVDTVTLYYRTKGETEWKSKRMTNNNDKYSAAIGVQDVTTAGIQYYIDACDGKNHTYRGSAEEPYEVTVQLAVDSSAKGDVDGNGIIEIKDAMMILMAVNDRLNLKEEEFARADLDGDGELSALEALKVIQYVNGTITSII